MDSILMNMKRYWKQLTAVVIIAIGAVVGLSAVLAAQVTVVVGSSEEAPVNISQWTVDHIEEWTASIAGIDQSEVVASNISWESSDPNVVMVTNTTGFNSDIKATGAGTATVSIKYTYLDANNNTQTVTTKKEFTVQLQITSNIPDGFIFLANPGDTFTVYTNYSSDAKDLIWESENASVATVAKSTAGTAVVTAGNAGGSSIIKVSTPNKDQYCTIYVLTKVKFTDYTMLELGPNEYLNVYTSELTGAAMTNGSALDRVAFASESDNYFTIDGTGFIYGINAGIKSLYVYPNFDYSVTPYANYTSAQLAGLFGDSKSVKVAFGIANGNLTAAVGDTISMRVNTTAVDQKGVNWTSDNTKVAYIAADGTVTAVSSGVAHITAILDSTTLFPGQRTHTSTVTITVVDSFSVNMTEKLINVGDTFELSALVTDKAAKVSWLSSDESVASFKEDMTDGTKITITGKKKGTATITAIQEVNGVKKYATCVVSVNEPVQSITLYPTEQQIDKGAQYPLVLTFTPNKPDNTEVLWVSSDTNIVKVSDTGVITGVGGGDATVSVITLDGIKVASCKVHVRVPVTGITLSKQKVEVSMSMENYQLSYTITPSGAGVDRNVTWSSSNEQVLKVNQNGFVTFVNPGKATVICQTIDTGTDGTNLIATCEFFINEPVISVGLDYTDVTLKIGDTFRLTAEVLPTNANDKSVTWISSNESVIKVDANGLLTAVGSGSAAVLVQSNDSGVTAMCNVSVYQPVEKVTMNRNQISVRKGTVFWLNAVAGPDNAVNKTIIWSSSDKRIATVDNSGMVTTLQPGECNIIATSQDTGVFATCVLTVTEPVTGITLNYTENTIYAGEKFVLIPTVTPLDADDKSVTYVSSDASVATVDEKGIVTGVKGGSCIILVTTKERGLIASCKVTVYEFVTSVKIGETPRNINQGASRSLTVTVTPDSATNRGVTWSSSNTSVLTVNQRGIVTAVGYGTATITATASDGSGIFDTCIITSIRPVQSITVSPSYVTLMEGSSQAVTATITPNNATIKDLDWSSSDESIAKVDYNGEITGVKSGICYVYAKSTDGNNIVGTVKVTVKPAVPATGITINSSSLTMLPGQSDTLTYRIKPTKTTDGVTWYSSDKSVVTVSATGVVTAKGQGNAVIYCVTSSGVESQCTINVLSLNSSNITVEQYDSYILDVFGATENIKWYTNNARVATVSANGTVIGRSVGTTTITAKVNGKILYCKVTVTKIKK